MLLNGSIRFVRLFSDILFFFFYSFFLFVSFELKMFYL